MAREVSEREDETREWEVGEPSPKVPFRVDFPSRVVQPRNDTVVGAHFDRTAQNGAASGEPIGRADGCGWVSKG